MTAVDTLTGLPLRDSFLRRVSEYLDDAREHGQPLSLLGLNVDYLAHYNYAYNPIAGDAALGAVATILRSIMHIDDLLCRSGGDEFLVLLSATPLPEALSIAERIRQAAVAVALVEPQPYAPRRCLTLSIGVATFPDDGSGIAALLETIASGIAQAKRNGRDATVHIQASRFP